MTRMGLSPTATSARAQSLGSTNQPLGAFRRARRLLTAGARCSYNARRLKHRVDFSGHSVIFSPRIRAIGCVAFLLP